ncbi:MAG: enoyl-CoA hydratase/isomerase family protein [Saprospiraceae bacterium]|nr:enoyl-CoA hydratase/isomerase family protein [Saprospiraceae bacterium]
MDKRQQGSVETSRKGGLAIIEFFHPAQNSLPGRLLAELTQAIQDAGVDETVKLILLKSAGDRTFCAGASFDELMAIEDLDTGKAFFLGFANVINALRKCPKLVVGRVQGKCVGGGVGLASAVDFCVATKYASVKLSELAVGIGPFVVGPAVERKIGKSAMCQLAINATEWKSAEWARDKGLFAEVFEDIEAMDAWLEAFLDRLEASNPEAMNNLKSVFWEGAEHWDELLDTRAAMSGKLVLSDYTKNAIAKFKTS